MVQKSTLRTKYSVGCCMFVYGWPVLGLRFGLNLYFLFVQWDFFRSQIRGRLYVCDTKLAKSAHYASSAFFRKIDEKYARNDELCQKLR